MPVIRPVADVATGMRLDVTPDGNVPYVDIEMDGRRSTLDVTTARRLAEGVWEMVRLAEECLADQSASGDDIERLGR